MNTFEARHKGEPNSLRVLIFGCGPAGLMAAQGVANARPDAEVDIVSKKRRSQMFGAQYLHVPIPGATNLANVVEVQYTLLAGEDGATMEDAADAYRRKVYGQMWDGSVSPEELMRAHNAWDIKEAYNKLWVLWEHRISNMEVFPHVIRSAIESKKYRFIFNSIPMNALCPEGHSFRSIKIRAMGDAPERDQFVPYECAPNTIVCNGAPEPSWYRLANVFGAKTVEWPITQSVPFSHAEVEKPLGNNCSCWPEVIRVGRYGRWEKGVLSHHAYKVAFDKLAGL